MRTKRLIRKIHRYLALLIGIQLLFWTLSGLYFTLFPIDQIRGSHLINTQPALEPEMLRQTRSPEDAWLRLLADKNSPSETQSASVATALQLQDMALLRRMDGFYYRVNFRAADKTQSLLMNAVTLDTQPTLTEASAITAAKKAFKQDAEILEVTRLTQVAPDNEYRGKPLPAWRVVFDAPGTPALWLREDTGELTAVRTSQWRLFDFLWMLHILDFDSRDNFNHWLLTTMASLGVLTVFSGFILWLSSTRLFRRKAKSAAQRSGQAARATG